MRIEALQDNKIVVELTHADMAELDITYEEMDYGNVETRRVIWTILDRARRTLSRDIDPTGKMLIETVPTQEGGCVLYFTVLQPQSRTFGVRGILHIRKEKTSYVYAFDSPDALTACAARLRAVTPPVKSSLYLLGGRYLLSVRAAQPPQRLRTLLAEYGTPCPDGSLQLACLREHGKLLAENDAVEKLTIGL